MPTLPLKTQLGPPSTTPSPTGAWGPPRPKSPASNTPLPQGALPIPSNEEHPSHSTSPGNADTSSRPSTTNPDPPQKLPQWIRPVTAMPGNLYIIAGTMGVGKTSLCAKFPSPLFVVDSSDLGVLRLMQAGAIPKGPVIEVKSSKELTLDTMDEFAKNPGPYKTLVFEGLQGWYHRICLPNALNRLRTRNEDTGWGADQREVLAEEGNAFLSSISKILKAGLNVVCTAHTKTGTKNNPMGQNYMTQQIDIPTNVIAAICKNATGVFCIVNVPEVAEIRTDDKTLVTGRTKTKGEEKLLFLNPTPGIEHAKNQFHCSKESLVYQNDTQIYSALIKEGMLV